jgi:hypothetical protein
MGLPPRLKDWSTSTIVRVALRGEPHHPGAGSPEEPPASTARKADFATMYLRIAEIHGIPLPVARIGINALPAWGEEGDGCDFFRAEPEPEEKILFESAVTL